ncbi:MAG: TetR family transcriptional regulator C-terminal domain-containing protein [Peptococcaceae bacterium]|nr:TetR family transcriptional regulator C-terminal domain-containing protein [Peptococcaceae bacterium]
MDTDAIADKFRQKYDAWRRDIREVFNALEMDPAKTGALSSIVLACIDGICLQYLLDPEALNLEEISAQLAEMLPLKPPQR